MPATTAQLEGLYLAYFGRPADADGLAFYQAHPELDIWAVARSFSESPESIALYGSSFGPKVIDAIYMNLFNRHAEADGLLYWSAEVASGHISAAGAAFAILLGAQNEDKACIDAKLSVCEAFTAAMDTPAKAQAYSGNLAAAFARDFIAAVDPERLGVGTATELVALELQAMSAITQVKASNTFTLSTPMSLANSVVLDAAHTNFVAAQGLRLDALATLGGVTSGASVELRGVTDGTLTTALKTDTGADSLLVKLNPSYADNHDAVSAYAAHTTQLKVPGVESLRVEITATNTSTPAGTHPDGAWTTLNLTGDDLEIAVITGNQALYLGSDFSGTPSVPKLRLVDASRLDAPAAITFDGEGTSFGFMYNASGYSDTAQKIIGSISSRNELFGSAGNDELIGGTQADKIFGTWGSDTLTGSGGNDLFGYDLEGPYDIDHITDFNQNTVGRGFGGAQTSSGAATSAAKLNGDVIDLSWFGGLDTIWVDVEDSWDYLAQHLSAAREAGGFDAYAVLDASSGTLVIAFDGHTQGIRMVLDGVTTIGTAAFLLDPQAA